MTTPRFVAALAILLSGPAVKAQLAIDAHVIFDGSSANALFGVSVSGAGDVNNDGYDDIIVGAANDGFNGNGAGSARVISGANGSTLYQFYGDSAGDNFGNSVSDAGDVNNDGFADFIVGAPGDDNTGSFSGSARVYSGANGSVLFTFNGLAADDNLGYSVSGAGDVNADGFDDVIVGSQRSDNNGAESGSASVFSGATGSVLYTFNGNGAAEFFGISVSGAGDVNNDGFDDVIIGAVDGVGPSGSSGYARVYSGVNGTILYTFFGDSSGDDFGFSVSGAGDVNADGFADVIVGANLDDDTGQNAGSARVFSGSNGAILYTFFGDSSIDNFGVSVSDAGDVNADGFDDVIVGAYIDDVNGTDSGSARVHSGSNGAVLRSLAGAAANDWFGLSVSGAGDINGDGLGDLLVGAYLANSNGSDAGSAYLYFKAYSFTPPPIPCPGDVNGDNLVNSADLSVLLANFGSSCP